MPNDDIMVIFDDQRGESLRPTSVSQNNAIPGRGFPCNREERVLDYRRLGDEAYHTAHSEHTNTRAICHHAGAKRSWAAVSKRCDRNDPSAPTAG